MINMTSHTFLSKQNLKKIIRFSLLFFLILAPLSFKLVDFDKEFKSVQKNLRISTAPTIQINSPFNYTLYGKIAPNFSLTIVDGLGNYSWYEFIDTGESSIPVELNGIINEDERHIRSKLMG